MKKYKCIKPFCIPECDYGGYETGNNFEVKAGEIYVLDESGSTYLGAEVHLDSADELSWIEITNEMFREYFEEVDE